MSLVSEWPEIESKRDLELKKVLTPDSNIWEIGGYLGTWIEKAMNLFDCHIEVFEPLPENFQELDKKFKTTVKVRINPYGLWVSSCSKEMNVYKDASSVFAIKEPEQTKTTVLMFDIVDEINKFGDDIDFMQMNCEGSEYALLEHLILNSGILKKIKRLRVQFHALESIPHYQERRDNIIAILKAMGYKEVFSIPFYWEEFEL